MEYNTTRGDMEYREYGRTIKKIIEKVSNYPDGEQKDMASHAIVYAMSQVSGMSVKDDVSYHKLWDHLMVLSSFRLEKAWPFTEEELESLKQRAQNTNHKSTERLSYKNDEMKSRYYGIYLEKMLQKMKDIPDGEEYQTLSTLLSQQAKRSYLVWNGELADDNIVVDQISRISGDERLKETLRDNPINVPANTLPIEPVTQKKKKKKK